MGRITHVPARHLDELRISFRRPHRSHVADRPHHQPGDPQPQSETESGRHRAVDDRDRTRRAGEQDQFRKRAVNRLLEPVAASPVILFSRKAMPAKDFRELIA